MRALRKALIAGAGLLGAGLGAGVFLGACVFAGPRYRGPVSDHFDGTRFHDDKDHDAGAADMLQWMASRDQAPWPAWIDDPPQPKPEPTVDGERLRVTFVNHATTLVQLEGANVLTDPTWAERASPVGFAGPKRVRAPGVRFEDLPHVDVVLISHNHWDHLDVPTLRRLARRDHPVILVGLGNGALLADAGIVGAREVDWGDVVTGPHGLRITSVANQHFSGRGLTDRDATLWTAFVIEGEHAGAVYFGGDTGYGTHFARVRARFPALRLAIIPIGAFRPEWFMSPVHVSPAQALQAHRDLGAGTSVAIHFGTFPLADDGVDEAPRALQALVDAVPTDAPGGRPRFWVLGFGEGRDVPRLPQEDAP